MFSKIIILFIAVGAAAAQVVSGSTYRITNFKTGGEARIRAAGDPIIVPNTHDYVGPYAEVSIDH